jgi:dephospho-CoA kinase
MRVALTGGIASGKSTVSDHWASLGAVIIDADVLAREVVEPGTPGLAVVAERFGSTVLTRDGSLDRAALAAIVFGQEAARKDLEALLHPRIRARAAELEAAAPADAMVVHVIPLLVETGQTRGFDAIVVVDLPTGIQVERTMARDDSTRAQVTARLAAQASREERLAVATDVIDNSGDRAALLAESLRVWDELVRRSVVIKSRGRAAG